MRSHLGAVGISHVGQPHRSEQDGVSGFGSVHRRRRQGLAGPAVQLGARFEDGEVEREAPDPLGHGLEQRDARLHHLAADTVAREDRNSKLAHTHP
jgi:hypothetical protein